LPSPKPVLPAHLIPKDEPPAAAQLRDDTLSDPGPRRRRAAMRSDDAFRPVRKPRRRKSSPIPKKPSC